MTTPNERCPHCGKLGIALHTGMVLLSYPEKHVMCWWCGDHGFFGGSWGDEAKDPQSIAREQWEKLNGKDSTCP